MEINSIVLIIMFILMLVTTVASAMAAYNYINKYNELSKRLNRFMVGRSAEDLEEVYVKLKEDVDFLMKVHDENLDELNTTTRRANSAFQKAGLVRYNAYEFSGGERSWVLTLLNNHNSGIILNCITGNETSVMYIRPVKEGKSVFKLSKEEVRSLEKAIDGK